jgi:hypothetical protein
MGLTFDQCINISSMVGTWLGSLFTLLGLLAVIAQLRALLKDLSDDREERIRNASGAWAPCLKNLHRSDNGIVEGEAPSVTAWIRHYYSNRQNISITPYERQTAGGQASWSRLFARLQILPEELMELAGPDSPHRGTEASTWWSRPGQTDLLVDGAKISYGLHGDEFAALLILSGFSPSNFHSTETSSDTGHLGYMYLGPHGPFSQIAQLDGSSKALSMLQPGELVGRYVHQINVQKTIDLALGIFRFNCLGRPRVVVLAEDDIAKWQPFGSVHDARKQHLLNACFANPSSQRILAVRRNLTHLTGGEVSSKNPKLLFDIVATAHFDFLEIYLTEKSWETPLNLRYESEQVPFELAMRIAVVVAALQPWGLPVILPKSLVDALCPLLEESSFLGASTDSPMLVQKVSEIPHTVRLNIPGWDWKTLVLALEGLKAVKTSHFSGLSSRCSLYYDTMVFLFHQKKIDMGHVGTGLAAWCAVRYLYPDVNTARLGEDFDEWERNFRAAVRERLHGTPIDDPPKWAHEILATFLHAWLKDSHAIKDNFRTIFRRRVFLG